MSEETTPPCNPPLTAEEIRFLDRTKLAFGHLSDAEMAGKVRMLMRGDLDHEAVCTGARDRIMHLSARIAELERERDRFKELSENAHDAMHEEEHRATSAEARIAELERERDEAREFTRKYIAANIEATTLWQAAEARATSAESLSAAAVERERVLREALEEIAQPHGQVTDLTAALELLVMVQFVARAALSSPAPGNGEAGE